VKDNSAMIASIMRAAEAAASASTEKAPAQQEAAAA